MQYNNLGLMSNVLFVGETSVVGPDTRGTNSNPCIQRRFVRKWGVSTYFGTTTMVIIAAIRGRYRVGEA